MSAAKAAVDDPSPGWVSALGLTRVAGVDEAGRGPLAGPVYAAAVILDPALPIPGLDDSKRLSATRREALAEQLRAGALAWGIGTADVAEIDAINILQATKLAMARAVEALPRCDPVVSLASRSRQDLATQVRAIATIHIRRNRKCSLERNVGGRVGAWPGS